MQNKKDWQERIRIALVVLWSLLNKRTKFEEEHCVKEEKSSIKQQVWQVRKNVVAALSFWEFGRRGSSLSYHRGQKKFEKFQSRTISIVGVSVNCDVDGPKLRNLHFPVGHVLRSLSGGRSLSKSYIGDIYCNRVVARLAWMFAKASFRTLLLRKKNNFLQDSSRGCWKKMSWVTMSVGSSYLNSLPRPCFPPWTKNQLLSVLQKHLPVQRRVS